MPENNKKNVRKNLTKQDVDDTNINKLKQEEMDPFIKEWEEIFRHMKGVIVSLKKIKEKSKDFFGSF